MRFLAVIVGLLMLSACDDMPQARTEGEIEDIASDAAVDATASKFTELESRIDELEAEKLEIEAKALELEADVSSAEANTTEVESDVAAFRSEYERHTH